MNRDFVINVLARREARKAVEAGIQAAGLKLHSYSKAEIDIAANSHLSGHRDEICALVVERYAALIAKFSTPAQRRKR